MVDVKPEPISKEELQRILFECNLDWPQPWALIVEFVALWLEKAQRHHGESGVWPGGFGGTGALSRSWRAEMTDPTPVDVHHVLDLIAASRWDDFSDHDQIVAEQLVGWDDDHDEPT